MLPPNFHGSGLSLWMGTLEWTDSGWKEAWERLLKRQDLRFIAVGLEEGVVVSNDLLSVRTFPWDRPPAMISALRLGAGDSARWEVRSNFANGV